MNISNIIIVGGSWVRVKVVVELLRVVFKQRRRNRRREVMDGDEWGVVVVVVGWRGNDR